MEQPKRLSVLVSNAHGHGVHALLPSESALVEVDVPGSRKAKRRTAAMPPASAWNETLEFEYDGSTPRAMHVEVKGVLQGGDVDLVGAGDVDLHAVLEGGTKQVIEVPLTKGGRELGAVELCIQHCAMPGH